MTDDYAARQRHELRQWAAKQPDQRGGNPVHLIRGHFPGDPASQVTYIAARWSLAARLLEDAARAGHGNWAQDLGPAEAILGRSLDQIPPNGMRPVGTAYGDRWIAWNLSSEAPPVPA